jgi:uncharacterized membrane protein YphA (DoxX/SURF4 family)
MKNKVLLVLSILFGLMFINAGLNKFLEYMPMPEEMPAGLLELNNAFESIGWLMPLVGVMEVIGGLLFMLKRYQPLGAVVIFPINVGILLTHIVNVPSGLPIALILMAINLWVIYEHRDKYMPMIRPMIR